MNDINKTSTPLTNDENITDYRDGVQLSSTDNNLPTPKRKGLYDSRYFTLAENQDFDHVPAYRRALVVFLYLSIPLIGFIIASGIVLTGPVYTRDKKTKTVYTLTTFTKILMLVFFGYWFLRMIFQK